MTRRSLVLAVCLTACLFDSVAAQCGGNGGSASLESTPLSLGSNVTLTLRGPGGQPWTLFISGAVAPGIIPGVCLSLTDPGFSELFSGVLPATGRLDLTFALPNDPALLLLVAYLQLLVVDPAGPAGIGLSEGFRVDFQVADTHEPLPNLGAPRGLATGTLLADGRVLVAGGGGGNPLAPVGTNTTEFFDPVTRSLVAGPNLTSNRAGHSATRLLDGRILLTGGVVNAAGSATASCEVFDPTSGLFTAVSSMGFPRVLHNAVLLGDGRVFVAGGASTFTAPPGTFGPILNTSHDTGETYDPTANTWTPAGNTMSSRRFGSAAALLADGRVLVISGLSGAIALFGVEVPQWTSSCSLFNPGTNLFSSAPALPAPSRALMGATTLADGRVWVTGGVVPNALSVPEVTASTLLFSAGTGWSSGPALPTPIALPSQALLKNGTVYVCGGASGSLTALTAVSECVRYTGSGGVLGRTPLAIPRGGHVLIEMGDGTVFIGGGADVSATAVATCLLYTPDP